MRAMGMTFGKSSEPSYFTFFEPHKVYRITRFQRAYTWKTYQIQGIIKDLKYIRDYEKQVGWPSILIQKATVKNGDPDVQYYDLGDGQQRVISVALGLIALWQQGYRKKSMGEISSDQFEYFRDIIPELGFQKFAEGVLAKSAATEYGISLVPTIRFYSKSADEVFSSLFSPLQAQFWQSIDKKIENSTDGSGILKAFKLYYEEFKSYDFDQLKEASDNLLSGIHLSVLEYDVEDNMQRAFANMNSFGVNLTESELVKAEFYGYFKSKSLSLAEELADFWTNELESSEWNTISPGPMWGSSRKSLLETFLKDFIHLYSNWDGVNNSQKSSNGNEKETRWLRDEWVKHLEAITDINEFWQQFKTSVNIFKTANSKKSFTPGTLEWDINYSYQTLGRVRYFPSILMKLNLAMSEEDLRKTLNTLQRYYLYLNFVTDEVKNLSQALLRKGTPLFQQKITHDEIVDFLQTASAPKSQWRSQSYIESMLSEATYEKTKNSDICELFIFVTNEDKKSKNMTSGMFNTRTYVDNPDKSREHILPLTPRKTLSLDERAIYDRHVARIGNSLILSTDFNKEASNKNIDEKISTYENSKWSPWGLYWIDEFLKMYDAKKGWGFDEIDNRSIELAKIFAQYLAPVKPYSEFKSLLKDHKPGDDFWDIDSEELFCLTINEDGLLEDIDGKQFGSFRDLRNEVEALRNRRTFNIYRIDEFDTPYEKVILKLDGPPVIERVTKPMYGNPKRKVVLYSAKFGLMSCKSSRQLYSEYFNLNRDKCIPALYSIPIRAMRIVKTETIDAKRSRYYAPIDDESSLYVNHNIPVLEQLIREIADLIEDKITIKVIEDDLFTSSELALARSNSNHPEEN